MERDTMEGIPVRLSEFDADLQSEICASFFFHYNIL